MTDEKKDVEEKQEPAAIVWARSEEAAEIAALRRDLIFMVGVSVGLMIALHLALRREG